jgi:hypothetical protein
MNVVVRWIETPNRSPKKKRAIGRASFLSVRDPGQFAG